MPPTEPEPEYTEFAPFTSSTRSRSNGSERVYCAESRTPSIVMSLLPEKPRRLMLSPYPPPPSPAPNVMPGSVERMSRRFSRFSSVITFCGTMVIDCGMSSSGAVSFGDVPAFTSLPSTVTLSSVGALFGSASPSGAAGTSAASTGIAAEANTLPSALAKSRFGDD